MKDLLAKAGRSDVVVESAAMHEDAIGCDTHRGTRRKLDEMGIPHPRREAWLLTAEKAAEYDLIVGMDRYNMADLEFLVRPEDRGKLKKLLSFAGSNRDVADPWYTATSTRRTTTCFLAAGRCCEAFRGHELPAERIARFCYNTG